MIQGLRPALERWWRKLQRGHRGRFLDEAELAALHFPVPHNHAETHDAIAALVVRAPDYRSRSEPEYDIEIGYSIALQGLDRLHALTPSIERAAHLDRCRATLVDAYLAFKQGNARKGLALVQAAERDFVALGHRPARKG